MARAMATFSEPLIAQPMSARPESAPQAASKRVSRHGAVGASSATRKIVDGTAPALKVTSERSPTPSSEFGGERDERR